MAGGEGRDLGSDLHVKGPCEPYCCSVSPNRCLHSPAWQPFPVQSSWCLCLIPGITMTGQELPPGLCSGSVTEPPCQDPTDTELSHVHTDGRCWRGFSPLRTGAGPFPALPSPPVSPGGADTLPNSPQETFLLADWYHHRDQHLDVFRQANPQCLRTQLHRLPPALPDLEGAQEVRRGLRGYLQVQLGSCCGPVSWDQAEA